MEQETTCCFTGHRPDKLPWGEAEGDPRCLELKRGLETVLALRERYPHITLEGVRPCESQADGWPEREKERYWSILDRCDYETLVQHRYDRGCMARRNRYMVDRSSRIIAVYDGVPQGGTAQTLLYAMRRGLKTDILSPEGRREA